MRIRASLSLLCALAATCAARHKSRVSNNHLASRAGCTLAASGGDDAPALLKAVKDCSTVVIPKGTTLKINTRLDMTNVQDKTIQLDGTIQFSNDMDYWTGNAFYFTYQDQVTFWLLGGKNIQLSGSGTLDGNGQVWYDAFATNSTLLRPVILTLVNATNVLVEGIKYRQSPEWHNLVMGCENVTFANVDLHSVSNSVLAKNTDGWNTYRSNNIVIRDSVIVNGDDCVALKPNSTNILVENVDCDGSHGMSVGSLGQYAGEYDIVKNVMVRNIKMANAQNGARIKAWAGPNVGSGIVKNITFENWVESNVDYPIVIDQCYFTNAAQCAANPSNTYIEDVVFRNFTGTSSGKRKSEVIKLACSPDGRCKNIAVDLPINLTPPATYGAPTYTCSNLQVEGTAASLFKCT